MRRQIISKEETQKHKGEEHERLILISASGLSRITINRAEWCSFKNPRNNEMHLPMHPGSVQFSKRWFGNIKAEVTYCHTDESRWEEMQLKLHSTKSCMCSRSRKPRTNFRLSEPKVNIYKARLNCRERFEPVLVVNHHCIIIIQIMRTVIKHSEAQTFICCFLQSPLKSILEFPSNALPLVFPSLCLWIPLEQTLWQTLHSLPLFSEFSHLER